MSRWKKECHKAYIGTNISIGW